MDRFPDVMILAAGLGLRMRPLTESTPKPLLEVAGTALLERVAGLAHAEGARQFVVNAHHHAGQVAAFVAGLEGRLAGSRFRVSTEAVLRNTGGGLKAALELLEGDPILVMNSDSLWLGGDRPLGRMLAGYEGRLTLLCVHPVRASGFTRRSHDFCLAPDGEITPDRGAPVIYAGAALVPRRLVELAPEGAFSLYDLFEASLAAGDLRGVALGADWLHAGDPAALAAMAERLGR